MNTVPIPDEIARQFPTFKRVLVGSTTGKLDGDGSSPEEAFAIEALIGIDEQLGRPLPMIREYWVPDSDELAELESGCPVELVLWMPQMPVHCLNVQPFPIQGAGR